MTEDIIFEQRGPTLVATINRPEALNALTEHVEYGLVERLEAADADEAIRAIVLTGVGRAFAAGADIGELQQKTHASMCRDRTFAGWDRLAALRTPKIAAVGGYALGGGCELAMMCDIIVASESARFGQPELRLGLIPGMGGTQRLTRLVGRARAMDLILTCRVVDAHEAERIGLASRVVEDDMLLPTAFEIADTIAGFGRHSVEVAREAVARVDEVGLTEGVRAERRDYFTLFDTPDAVEGMEAFLEKRAANFG